MTCGFPILTCAILAASGLASPLVAQPGRGPVSDATTTLTNQWTSNNLPDGGRPVEVRASFHLIHVHQIDDDSESFEFSGVLTLVWKDARQAFDPVAEGVEEKYLHGAFQFNELSPSWYPQVVLANASAMPETQGVLLRLKPDGTGTLIQPIQAVARSRLDLRRYPFDRQRLEAVFSVLGFSDDEVRLIPAAAPATVDRPSIWLPQWDLTDLSASTQSMASPFIGAEGLASAFVVSLEVQRHSFFMLRLVILPLIVIVVLSWSVFWMDRSSLGDRMSVSFVGILTAVAYQIMVSDIMPHISYVTWMNAFLSLSFLIMSATVVVNLIVGACDKRGNSKRGDRIDSRCRWLFPLIYAGLLTLAWVVAFVAL